MEQEEWYCFLSGRQEFVFDFVFSMVVVIKFRVSGCGDVRAKEVLDTGERKEG